MDIFLLKGAHSPPFSRRGGCASIRRSRSLAAQTGWLVKGRAASLFLFETTNHPACAVRDASRHLLIAQPPLLEKEGNGAQPHLNLSPLRPFCNVIFLTIVL